MKLYVIGHAKAGPLKIGIAKNPAARVRQLQGGNPYRLKCLHTVDCGEYDAATIERMAHSLLRENRLSGEWFDVVVAEARAAVDEAITKIQKGEFATLGTATCSINIRVDDNLKAAIDAAAEEQGLPVASFIKSLLTRYLLKAGAAKTDKKR